MSCPTGLIAFQFGTLLARFMAANPLSSCISKAPTAAST